MCINLYLPHCHIYGRKGLEIYIIVNDLLGCSHLTGSAWSSPSTPPSARNPQDYLADKSLVGLTNGELKKALKKPFYTLSDIFIVVKFQDKTYHFLIPKGYDWNGANVPPFCWLIIGQQKEPRFKLPSCVHDYLCEHKEVIDNNRYLSTLIFETLCEYFGRFNALKRWAMFHSVDNYQKLCCWKKGNKNA